ncbi:hypothetical protein [Natronoglycomyces albus]|uniref:Uncharacterized protein n=1 Tax=Natronoglycomyces albus TaxID=2811108 RepID=A0A895XI33_9ACTN|nr:hypothetical protein [Natronoglycomyces albus]QSB05481.1 hypothetical protein JQS30_00610 [Natronoglycomyces albus]
MIDWMYYSIQALTLGIAAYLLWETYRSQLVGRTHFIALGVIEAALVVQFITALVLVIPAAGDSKALFFSYLLTAMLVLPIAAVWGSIDRSRWGIGTVAIGCLVASALLLRVNQIWDYQVNV